MNAKDWFPRMPQFKWPTLMVHVPTWLYLWSFYVLCMYGIYQAFGHGIVVKMFENIPEADFTFGIIAAVAIFMALLVVFSQFVANQKDELVKQKEAKIAGEVYDEVNGEISKKMFWGQPVLAILAAVALSGIVLFAINEIADSEYAKFVATQGKCVLVGIVAELIAFAIFDRFFLRAAMDGLFFERVEKPATEKFLKGDIVDAVEEAVTQVKSAAEKRQAYLDAGFTEDEALALMAKKQ